MRENNCTAMLGPPIARALYMAADGEPLQLAIATATATIRERN
jgi:hypothetical protein